MSASEQPPGGPGAGGEPSEDELRAAYEAELSRISATDMIAQATVSLLNIGARRVTPPPPDPAAAGEPGGSPAEGAPVAAADLEQARDAIDGARALLGILERRIPQQELAPLRDALSRLQMAYAGEAQRVGAGGDATGSGGEGGEGGEGQEQQSQQSKQSGPGPAEASGRLWVPGR